MTEHIDNLAVAMRLRKLARETREVADLLAQCDCVYRTMGHHVVMADVARRWEFWAEDMERGRDA
ncbi:MAG: hypothetical protein KGN77_05070 [Xanthomonadaceae bacterium]|nr:hypothetical protein [Xanthomonadaceae bacterium]